MVDMNKARVMLLERRMAFIREAIAELWIWVKENDLDIDKQNRNGVCLNSTIYDIMECTDFDSTKPEVWQDPKGWTK